MLVLPTITAPADWSFWTTVAVYGDTKSVGKAAANQSGHRHETPAASASSDSNGIKDKRQTSHPSPAVPLPLRTLEHPGRIGGLAPLDAEVVLDGDRDALQRASAAPDPVPFLVAGTRLPPGVLFPPRDKGIQRRTSLRIP
jgi:hypothetical protein